MTLIKWVLPMLMVIVTGAAFANSLPLDFVYLSDIDPTIIQEMRYAGSHNFVGRPIQGYEKKGTCILTRAAATALHEVQIALKKASYSLKVYDCYRPQQAVDDFIAWSVDTNLQAMKAEFYPHTNKANFFQEGYVAEKSGHTRGSTIDLTVVSLPISSQPDYHSGQPLIACTAPFAERFHDNSLDFGTGYDCMDPLASGDNTAVDKESYQRRQWLRSMMVAHGFVPYEKEWWHFTLKNEPYPATYFNFPVTPSSCGLSAGSRVVTK